MRTEAREFLGHLHNLDLARRRDTQRHAAQTGRFVGQLHDLTRRRKARNRATMRHLHDQDMGRRDEVQEHAAQTGRFMGQLHDLTRQRKARNRATMRHLHDQDMGRRDEVQEHAAQTGRFMGQLHSITRARRRDVRRHAAETGRFVHYLHGVTRQRKNQIGELMSHFAGLDVARRAEVAQLVGHARAFMAGLAAITQEGRHEWRRHLAAINSTGREATRTGRRAAARGGSSLRAMQAEPETPGGMLVYIAEHPGTRLPEMEKALGINRIEAAKGVRALLDQGTVRRDEETRQYFPV
jgi:hypothetical protein